MRKRQSGLDLDNSEDIDFLHLGFDTPHVNTPRIDELSDSDSFRNNPLKDNQMFNSPIRRAFVSGLTTPLGNFPSIGFTPFTPKEIDQNNIMTSSKTQLNDHQILNFEEDSLENSSEGILQVYPKTNSLEALTKNPSINRLNRETTLSITRIERKRKQIDTNQCLQVVEPKSFRGLRNLASRVKQIAAKLGIATSKEIAEALIKQLQEEKQISPNTKEYQNIRRRVYDALKVLVSSDVLIRDADKKLIARPSPTKNSSLEATRAALREKVALAKKTIEEKTQKAITMNNKFVVGQQLIEHNKNNPSNQNQRIYLPFLAIQTSQTNLQYIETDKTQGTASVGLNKGRVRMLGDIDLILQLRILQEKKKGVETKISALQGETHTHLESDVRIDTQDMENNEQ